MEMSTSGRHFLPKVRDRYLERLDFADRRDNLTIDG